MLVRYSRAPRMGAEENIAASQRFFIRGLTAGAVKG